MRMSSFISHCANIMDRRNPREIDGFHYIGLEDVNRSGSVQHTIVKDIEDLKHFIISIAFQKQS